MKTPKRKHVQPRFTLPQLGDCGQVPILTVIMQGNNRYILIDDGTSWWAAVAAMNEWVLEVGLSNYGFHAALREHCAAYEDAGLSCD